METNYRLSDDFITIEFQGQSLDLHNIYSLINFHQTIGEHSVRMDFERTLDFPTLKRFSIEFTNVSAVYSKKHDINYPTDSLQEDSKIIDLIGFSYDSDEIMNGPTDYLNRPDLPTLLFVFVTGKAIKISAEKSELHPGQ